MRQPVESANCVVRINHLQLVTYEWLFFFLCDPDFSYFGVRVRAKLFFLGLECLLMGTNAVSGRFVMSASFIKIQFYTNDTAPMFFMWADKCFTKQLRIKQVLIWIYFQHHNTELELRNISMYSITNMTQSWEHILTSLIYAWKVDIVTSYQNANL